jgi:hypothetical protein
MLENIRWTRGSNELVVVDALVDLAKRRAKRPGRKTVVMRFPDWAPHMQSRTYRFQLVLSPFR